MPATVKYKKGQKLKYVDPETVPRPGALSVLRDNIKIGKGYCFYDEDSTSTLIYVKHVGFKYQSLIKRIWVTAASCIQR